MAFKPLNVRFDTAKLISVSLWPLRMGQRQLCKSPKADVDLREITGLQKRIGVVRKNGGVCLGPKYESSGVGKFGHVPLMKFSLK